METKYMVAQTELLKDLQVELGGFGKYLVAVNKKLTIIL